MEERERQTSPLVNALWGSGIVQPRASREQLRAARWRLVALLAVVVLLPIAVGLAAALGRGSVIDGILAGGAMLLVIFFAALVFGAIVELRRTRRQRSE